MIFETPYNHHLNLYSHIACISFDSTRTSPLTSCSTWPLVSVLSGLPIRLPELTSLHPSCTPHHYLWYYSQFLPHCLELTSDNHSHTAFFCILNHKNFPMPWTIIWSSHALPPLARLLTKALHFVWLYSYHHTQTARTCKITHINHHCLGVYLRFFHHHLYTVTCSTISH